MYLLPGSKLDILKERQMFRILTLKDPERKYSNKNDPKTSQLKAHTYMYGTFDY